MITADEALAHLKAGNARFCAGENSVSRPVEQIESKNISESQAPFAVILGCADSRVPAEIVFDQGLGDLFVIRVAGNIVAPSQIGSVEFAVEQFGTPLVVVLGHSKCGAVKATLSDIENPSDALSCNLQSIVKRIRPALEPLAQTELRNTPNALLEASIRANILAAMNHLSQGSELLKSYLEEKRVQIVGAEYCLETGRVDFIETA